MPLTLPSKKVLTLEAAKLVAGPAEATATAGGWKVVIAGVDDGGHAILLQRTDGTQSSSVKLRFGTVGAPVPGVEIKIALDGEILARGPNVMKGYYKKEAETREVFEDGWFKTGDIGRFDADGFLVITHRKKDLIITAGWNNVAHQPIENLLKTNPYILNAVVVGGNRKFISALIVPDFERLEAWARARNLAFADRSPQPAARNGRVPAR